MALGEMGDLNPPPALTQDSRMLILPYEILLLVAELLPLRSWNALVQTCRRLYYASLPSLYSIAASTKNSQGDVFKCAARNGRLDTIHRLMDYAPDGYFNCVYGEANLRAAAGAGQTEIIRWLLDSGIDPYCTQTRSDDFKSWAYIHGAPPLLIAARCGNTEAAELLLDVMPDFDYVRSLEESTVIEFVRKKQTALLESILCRGIDVDQRDIHRQTALFHAHTPGHTAVPAENVLEAVVELLLQRGARVDMTESAKINLVNRAHRTALSRAAEKGRDKAVEILLQYGAEVDMQDHIGQTPPLWAIQNEHERCVELLIQGCADVTKGDIEPNTARVGMGEREKLTEES
ncbi:hypothetical protein ALT_2475 [Aspergillus lentulus]|uniref:Ankyrin n=1 Tax=Aspergillus lentulus TaxID=293939 RepID=A0AAN4PEP0_ASPLE|nr:hypothetical protein ALT_2475 [Aspergillus lentulus]